MAATPVDQPNETATLPAQVPDRLCTWCKVPMLKRLVADGRFIHYTCPTCIFQHASKREKKG